MNVKNCSVRKHLLYSSFLFIQGLIMMNEQLHEIKCIKCGKKLGMLKGVAEIKCPRCKTVNNHKK